jgi:hypothetical protein
VAEESGNGHALGATLVQRITMFAHHCFLAHLGILHAPSLAQLDVFHANSEF